MPYWAPALATPRTPGPWAVPRSVTSSTRCDRVGVLAGPRSMASRERRSTLMATITKKDLVDRICGGTTVKRAQVRKVIKLFLHMIADELAGKNRLEFREFGVFEVRIRAPRIAQNPKTLE